MDDQIKSDELYKTMYVVVWIDGLYVEGPFSTYCTARTCAESREEKAVIVQAWSECSASYCGVAWEHHT